MEYGAGQWRGQGYHRTASASVVKCMARYFHMAAVAAASRTVVVQLVLRYPVRVRTRRYFRVAPCLARTLVVV